MKKLCFIAVNYESSDHTVALVQSLCDLQNPNCGFSIDVLIVDNSVSKVERRKLDEVLACYDCCKVIRPEKNLGYFGGLNQGLQNIVGSQYNYVIIGNNDLVFSANFGEQLFNMEFGGDVFVVAPNVVTKDGRYQNPHVINRISKYRKLIYDIYFSNYYAAAAILIISRVLKRIFGQRDKSKEKSQYIHMGIGACYILTPIFFTHYKCLDDVLFLYGEEAILAGQVMRAGGKIYYERSLVVTHAESATLGKIPSKYKFNIKKKSYPLYRQYL